MSTDTLASDLTIDVTLTDVCGTRYSPEEIAAAVERVLAGSAMLSEHDDPDWYMYVHPDILWLGDMQVCVLGQRYQHEIDEDDLEDVTGYDVGILRLFNDDYTSVDIIRKGFTSGSDSAANPFVHCDFDLLTQVWRIHLTQLRHEHGLS